MTRLSAANVRHSAASKDDFVHASASVPSVTEALPNPAPEGSSERPKMVVGTFHKTGTWLMIGIFSRICKELGYRMWMRGTEKTRDEWDLFLDPLSRFDPCHLEGNFRGTVVIRDPRDVIISGAFYHGRLKKGQNDAWVHLPSPAYDGMTYQEKLNSLPSDEARFAFEMDNMGGRTIERMQRFVSLRPEFRLTRFEDLVTDEGTVRVPSRLRLARHPRRASGPCACHRLRAEPVLRPPAHEPYPQRPAAAVAGTFHPRPACAISARSSAMSPKG
jgi:hypothetical protein